MPTLLIVEDNLPLAQCLRLELEAEGFKAVTAPDAAAALLELQVAETVDLLVVDWDLPDISGLELLRRLRKHNFQQPVLMLTGHDEVDRKVLALESGADDYMVKPFSFDELQARIQALLRRSSSHEPAESGDPGLRSLLSQREWDVLMELGKGKSNAEIAEALFLSLETIKSHIKALLQKLRAKDRTHAVVIAFQQGWLH
ncbi:MAG: response regulator transcription factor [Synechococcus sp. ELA619]|jgi:DNA-binding NarL/FixJ family response regulator